MREELTTEEKARIYSDGIQKGIGWGLNVSYKRDKAEGKV